MSNQLEQDVRDFVAGKVANGETFTAFQITDELGAAKHRYVRPIVHALFSNGEFPTYESEASTTIQGNPIVYKPRVVVKTTVSGTVMGGIKSLSQAATALKTAAQVAVANTTPRPTVGAAPTPNPVTLTGEDVSLNENGSRLRVRKGTVVNAGFNAGTELYVTYSPKMNTVMLSNKKQTTNDSAATHDVVQVDVKQNVRLNVDKLGISGSKFLSNADKGVILVSVQ